MAEIDKESIKEIINDTLSGVLSIFVTRDKQEAYMLQNASSVFSVLFDIVHGEFYRENIKYGDPEKKFGPGAAAALDAYRQYIFGLIEENKLDLM